MSWFSKQWDKWATDDANPGGGGGGRSRSNGDGIRRIEVVWGKERLQIVLPKTAGPVTLGDLKHEIASITSLPYERLKLISRGLVMKDDRLPLSAYGLQEGSRIGLVGSRDEGDRPGNKTSVLPVGEQKAREKKAKEADTSESGLLARIQESLDHCRHQLFPDVVRVEQSVAAHLHSPTPTPTTSAAAPTPLPPASAATSTAPTTQTNEPPLTLTQISDAHRRLSEFLLRQLLALDSVQVNSETTRQARKLAVKEVQSHLDRLDHASTLIKQQHNNGNAAAL